MNHAPHLIAAKVLTHQGEAMGAVIPLSRTMEPSCERLGGEPVMPLQAEALALRRVMLHLLGGAGDGHLRVAENHGEAMRVHFARFPAPWRATIVGCERHSASIPTAVLEAAPNWKLETISDPSATDGLFERPPHLLLLSDNADGSALMARVREAHTGLWPFAVALGSRDDLSHRRAVLKAGFDDHWLLPIDAFHVRRTLKRLELRAGKPGASDAVARDRANRS